jgi:peptidoglycan/LPS O-acetylase OafA/YrhL
MSGPQSPPTRVGYIPTLDGWRAIAVFSVILYHDKLHRFGHFSDSLIHNYGAMGVDLFFAISGILICSRLLDEEYANHSISLRDFYVRRFCRILPPAWLYLAVLAILGIVHVVRVGFSAWLAALLFVENYYLVHTRSVVISVFTNHFWSLAIEEHFYLILPGILVLFRARRIFVLASLIAAFFVYRLIIHSHTGWLDFMGGNAATQRTELRINALLFPALLAILLRKPAFHRFAMRWFKPLIAIPALVAIFAAAYFMALKAHSANSGFILILTNFGFPVLILSTMLHPRALLSRLLEIAPLRHLGKIS